MTERWVEITFDCLPLRSVGRLDIPIDASPKYRERCERIKEAIEKHGTQNTYYFLNAKCTYHLTNGELGLLQFRFEGAALTDTDDRHCVRCDLQVRLYRETCDWLTDPIIEWFRSTVDRSVAVEFDRYIAAGDLQRTRERIEELQQSTDDTGGFVGMYL